MAPIKTFMDTFDKGMLPVPRQPTPGPRRCTIVDEVPPYLWHGPDAFTAWSKDLDADSSDHAWPMSTILPVTPPWPSTSCARLASVSGNRCAISGLIFCS
jgi:hypothetical protein